MDYTSEPDTVETHTARPLRTTTAVLPPTATRVSGCAGMRDARLRRKAGRAQSRPLSLSPLNELRDLIAHERQQGRAFGVGAEAARHELARRGENA